MKYHYYYQSSKNENIDGWITAKSRDDAYAQLRKANIKPYKVVGKNPLAWKRWTTIVVLSLALIAALLALHYFSTPEPTAIRAALYGDAATIQRLAANDWRDTFTDPGDAFLARHAIPGVVCDCPSNVVVAISPKFIPLAKDDTEELRKMKRMVNGMKAEMRDYLAAGGTLIDYIDLCCERCRTEKGIQDSINAKFNLLRKKDPLEVMEAWEKHNKTLRSLGLPTVPLPIEE